MKKQINQETIKYIRKTQSVLTKIDQKVDFFFNITVYKNLGLIKEHGKTIKNKTNWVLTEKGKKVLNFQI